jgi:hypothetical protein
VLEIIKDSKLLLTCFIKQNMLLYK